MIALSVVFALVKQRALDFHERDFPYYAQFDVRLFDGRYEPRYSLSPNGHDLFGFVGTEGARSLHQAIHFEPVKYVMAAVYRLTGHLAGPFALIAAMFFAPVLFLATRMPRRDRLDVAFAVLAAIAYALYPSALEAATFDLRPFSLLMPLFMLAALSVIFRRPRRETLFLFNALFLVREEALIFGVVVLLVALAVDQRLLSSPRSPDARRPPIEVMVACYVAWTAIEIAYFAWCGYGNVQPLAVPLAIAGFALIGGGAVVLAARRLRRGPGAMDRLLFLPPLTVMLVFPPLVLQQVFDRDLVNHPDLFFYAPMYALHAGCVLLALVATWSALRSLRARRTWVGIALALVVVALGALVAPSHRAPLSQLSLCRARSVDAEIVFDVRDETSPLVTSILTDQATFQAFYDYENVIVYERLPWHVVPGEERRWPRNQARLEALLEEQIAWVVVSRASHADVGHIIEGARLDGSVQLVAENDHYEVYRVMRP